MPSADPSAQDNVAKDHVDIVERLLEEYTGFNSTSSQIETPTIVLDKQTEEQLEALGYIEVAEYAVKPVNSSGRGPIVLEDDSDLDGVGDAQVGDDVLLLGDQGAETIGLEELAGWSGRSCLDTVLAFSGRLDARYRGDD